MPGSILQGQQHLCDSFTLLACTGVNERNESPCPAPPTLLALKQELKGEKTTFFCFINRRVYGGVLFNMARHGPAEALLFLAGDSKPASTSSIHVFPCYRPFFF